jgi:hypothetical protein
MHLTGSPFHDAELLGIAHAYEQASNWSQRRPIITADTKRAPIETAASEKSASAADPAIVDLCARAAHNAGLRLADRPFALLCSTAPHLLAMLDRIRSSREPPVEPANVFRFRAKS